MPLICSMEIGEIKGWNAEWFSWSSLVSVWEAIYWSFEQNCSRFLTCFWCISNNKWFVLVVMYWNVKDLIPRIVSLLDVLDQYHWWSVSRAKEFIKIINIKVKVSRFIRKLSILIYNSFLFKIIYFYWYCWSTKVAYWCPIYNAYICGRREYILTPLICHLCDIWI